MSAIADWMDRLGLGEYATEFETRRLSLDDVVHLSDDELSGLGIGRPEHLRLLRQAIARLSSMVEPQRRHLTAFFCDLVDSTGLAVRLDPESLAPVLEGFARCAVDAVEAFGGTFHQFRGDQVVAYFGAMEAQEMAAEGAIRAALQLLRTLQSRDFAPGVRLRACVGIASGIVFIGGLLRGNKFEVTALVGETPHLAARLQAAAPPNGIVIASSTYRLAGGLFDIEPMAPLALKGFANAVLAWQVLGEAAQAPRSAARGLRVASECLGREEPLSRLAAAWRLAETGRGRIVLVTGEAGIGKSRLVQEFTSTRPPGTMQRIDWSGSPYLENSPLAPPLAWLASTVLLHNDDHAANRARSMRGSWP